MSANDSQRLPHLTTEMKLIEEGLKANLPVLGICLGAQLIAKTLGQTHRFRISAAALRTVDHRGGLDAFLAKAPDAELSARALRLKREIAKAQAAG